MLADQVWIPTVTLVQTILPMGLLVVWLWCCALSWWATAQQEPSRSAWWRVAVYVHLALGSTFGLLAVVWKPV